MEIKGIYYGETVESTLTDFNGVITLNPSNTRRYDVRIGMSGPNALVGRFPKDNPITITDKNGKQRVLYVPEIANFIWRVDNTTWKSIDLTGVQLGIGFIMVREKFVSEPDLWAYEPENEISYESASKSAMAPTGFEWDNTNPGVSANTTIFNPTGTAAQYGKLTITAINNSAVPQQLNLTVGNRQWIGSLAAGATASFVLPLQPNDQVVVQDIAGQAAKSYSVVGVVSFA